MKKLFVFWFLIVSFNVSLRAQVISQFTWDSNPVTTAIVGPNATSASAVAISSPGGSGGTNGLNAGTPATDINLTIPGSPVFDVPGIDISVDFKRKETRASFFTRGASLDFGITGGNLYVNFLVSNGVGGSTTVNSGNVFAVPSDNLFHTYRFEYDNVSGKGAILVDGVNKFAYTGIAGRALYWTGAGNVVVGALMDGSGNNVAILDNLKIQIPAIALPLILLDFSGTTVNNVVKVQWTTTQENGTDRFELDKSYDGQIFSPISVQSARGNAGNTITYEGTDQGPLKDIQYYRLKIIDRDGKFTYSPIILIHAQTPNPNFLVAPNPAKGIFIITLKADQQEVCQFQLYDASGRKIRSFEAKVNLGVNNISMDITNQKNGMYFLKKNSNHLYQEKIISILKY